MDEDEKVTTVEGCLSLKDKKGNLLSYKVERYLQVKITGHKLVVEDEPILEPVDKILLSASIGSDKIPMGVVFQHEIDHQDGILISGIGEQIDIWR